MGLTVSLADRRGCSDLHHRNTPAAQLPPGTQKRPTAAQLPPALSPTTSSFPPVRQFSVLLHALHGEWFPTSCYRMK